MDPDLTQATLTAADGHWWYDGRAAFIAAFMRSQERTVTTGRVLDVGCGGGALLDLLGEFGSARGIDPDRTSVALGRNLGRNISYFDGETIPFESSSFELVCAFDVIEHLDGPVKLLSEMRRVCTSGGHLCVTVPALPRLWSNHDIRNGHRKRYTRKVLRQELTQAGWRVESLSAFNYLLLTPAAIVRGLGSFRSNLHGDSDLDAGRRLGPYLRSIFEVEAKLRSRGINSPIGMSLIAAATNPSQPNGR